MLLPDFSPSGQAFDLIDAFLAQLDKKPSKILNDEDRIGETEWRLCAQCLVLLLRLGLQDAKLQHTHSKLAGALKSTASCASHAILQSPLLAAGLLSALVPLIAAPASAAASAPAAASALATSKTDSPLPHRPAATDGVEPQALIETTLRITISLAPATRAREHDSVGPLISALAKLLPPPAPDAVRLLAASALRTLVTQDESTRCAVVSTPPALANLVHASEPASSEPPSPLVEEAVRALCEVAGGEAAHEVELTNAGAIRLFLRIAAGNGSKDEAAAATPESESGNSELAILSLEALANLADCAIARRAVVNDADGIRMLSSHLIRNACERSYKSAGWVLVSIAVDPDLGEDAVEAGALPGLVAYASSVDDRLREEAAWALANLSSVPSNAAAMAEPSVLSALLTLVGTGGAQPKVGMQAVWAVANLAVHEPLKRSLGEQGAVTALMEQIELRLGGGDVSMSSGENGGSPTGAAIEPARVVLPGGSSGTEDDDAEAEDLARNTLQQSMRAIANLAVDTQNRPRILAAGADGLATVVRAASVGGFAALKEVSARCLVNLSFDTITVSRFVEMGGIDVVCDKLILQDEGSAKIQQEAVLIALNVSTRMPQALVADHHLEALMGLLQPEFTAPEVQERVTRLLYNLSGDGMPSKLALFKHGALNRLHTLVAHADVTESVRAAATEVLQVLGSVLTPTSRRALVQASLLPKNDELEYKSTTRERRVVDRGWSTRGAAPVRSSPLAGNGPRGFVARPIAVGDESD